MQPFKSSVYHRSQGSSRIYPVFGPETWGMGHSKGGGVGNKSPVESFGGSRRRRTASSGVDAYQGRPGSPRQDQGPLQRGQGGRIEARGCLLGVNLRRNIGGCLWRGRAKLNQRCRLTRVAIFEESASKRVLKYAAFRDPLLRGAEEEEEAGGEEEGRARTKQLQRCLGGDPGSTGEFQVGRLPGSRNRNHVAFTIH